MPSTDGKNLVNNVYSLFEIESIDVVRQIIDNHRSPHVRWIDGIEGSETCIVVFLQLYFDKCETTIKVNVLTFYPFNVKIMNVSEECGN